MFARVLVLLCKHAICPTKLHRFVKMCPCLPFTELYDDCVCVRARVCVCVLGVWFVNECLHLVMLDPIGYWNYPILLMGFQEINTLVRR